MQTTSEYWSYVSLGKNTLIIADLIGIKIFQREVNKNYLKVCFVFLWKLSCFEMEVNLRIVPQRMGKTVSKATIHFIKLLRDNQFSKLIKQMIILR